MREIFIGIFSVNSVPYEHNASVVKLLMKEYHIGMTKGLFLSSLNPLFSASSEPLWLSPT